MTTYGFATIDPRAFALKGELDKLAGMGKTLGAEVTVPVLADALTEGNIDPSAGRRGHRGRRGGRDVPAPAGRHDDRHRSAGRRRVRHDGRARPP